MEIVIIVLVAIGVIVAIVLGALYEKKRREELARWARNAGWSWWPEKRGSPGFPFDVFNQGHSRYSRYHAARTFDDITSGIDQSHFELFEYHYAVTTHNGKNSQTHHYYFTCAMVDAGADLGNVSIRDEHLGDKLFQAIGFDDIDLEDPVFSKQYVVKARDRRDAYDLIGPAMMQYLVRNKGWKVETSGRTLFIHKRGRVSAHEYERIWRFAAGILQSLPRTLVNAERARRGLPPLIEAGAAARFSRRDLVDRAPIGAHQGH